MEKKKKRAYESETRDAQAAKTRSHVLKTARDLFEEKGFDEVTIKEIAKSAGVSMPTIYATFKSKSGVLQSMIDDALPHEKFTTLVKGSMEEKSPRKRLFITAKLAREIYDAEKKFMDVLRGAPAISPELKELEQAREKRRYERQGEYAKKLSDDKALSKELTLEKARDVLWSLTGRDLYRMLIIERGWSSEEYEKWLGELLVKSLLTEEHQK